MPNSSRPFARLVVAFVLGLPPMAGQAKPREAVKPTTAELAKRVGNEADLRRSGWTTPRPPYYPYQAHQAHEQGKVYVELTTDASGKVIRATTPRDTKQPHLSAFTASFALQQWHGPPHATAVVVANFQLR